MFFIELRLRLFKHLNAKEKFPLPLYCLGMCFYCGTFIRVITKGILNLLRNIKLTYANFDLAFLKIAGNRKIEFC